ncbi:hypothetical protein ABKN59_011338 [Abortiporus biennis]
MHRIISWNNWLHCHCEFICWTFYIIYYRYDFKNEDTLGFMLRVPTIDDLDPRGGVEQTSSFQELLKDRSNSC